MRMLALDMGEKNIGVAVSDPLEITAQGVGVIRRSNMKKDLARIGEMLQEYEVEKIVLGYPLNMDGSVGEKAREIEIFKDKLAKTFSLPVVIWDERLTTAAAQRTLLNAGLGRARRKKVIDKVAAVLILESYLQSRSSSTDKGDGERVK